ncbi:MAG: hypothetical protein JSS20_06530 [Proteobacteria bacterium]|nr:hypothetical protein [Pseudomonadota bacterium]
MDFSIGVEGYSADSVEDARRIIDVVLDTECVVHRGVLAAPVGDGALTFEVAEQRFVVDAPSAGARQFAARALIDALLQQMH